MQKNIKTNILIALGIVTVAQGHDELEETTVVASRSELEYQRVVDSVSVIGGPELVANGLLNGTDGLDSLPGVLAPTTSGQRGGTGTLLIRGLRTNDSQLRLDGVRISNRSFALGTVLGQLSNSSFEKIEVLKGGNSALYGSSAVAGVVNLTTRSGVGERSSFDLEIGSFDTVRANLTSAGASGDLQYFFQQSVEHTVNDTFGGNSEVPGFDNDFLLHSSVLRLDYRVNDDVIIGGTYRTYNGEYESPQFGGSLTEAQTDIASLYLDAWLTNSWSTRVTLGYFKEDSDFVTFGSFNQYEQLSLAWENSYKLSPDTQINFGVEYEYQDFDDGSVQETDNYVAGYVNVNHQFTDAFILQGGLRYEDFDSFGEDVNWKFGAKYKVLDSTSVKANIGTGFRAPSYLDLFSPVGSFVPGNPNLNPESSLSWEVGIEQDIGHNGNAKITFFETDVEDLIVTDFFAGAVSNVSGKSKASGIEASIHGQITEKLTFDANYLWLDNSLNGQPEQSARVALTYKPTDKWHTGLAVNYVDQRSFGGGELDDYVKVDIHARYSITDSLSVNARIENLFDERYEHANFFGTSYPARRLGAFTGFTYTW